MLYSSIFIIFGLTFINCALSLESLEVVTDDTLLKDLRTEQYVVVLFTSSKDCPECENYENEVLKIRDDLVDILSAWVLKSVDSPIKKLYNPSKGPALVFFRNGIPLLYDGPLDDEEILQYILDNKEPIVKELTDDTFEHLTQASTGATTGDWFVMFYTNDCVECQRLGARWEAVGAKLKQRLNVARVNKYTTGAATARRFNVFDVPEFILFRQSKLYRYQIKKHDVNAFVLFAKDWYRNVNGEKVPVPQSPFDDLTLMIANFLRENPWVFKLGSIVLAVIIIITVISKLMKKPDTSEIKNKAK